MKKQFLKTALITMAVVGVLSGSALATQITGGLSMSGAWTPILADGTATTIPLSTGVDFLGITEHSTPDNTFVVNSSSGDFDNMPLDLFGIFTTGNINNFQFVSFAPVTTPLWTTSGFSFVMDSLTWEKKQEDGNYDLLINGLGTLSMSGFEDTPGSWNFSSQGAGGANFSWSASTAASPVPEPATMLLFGSGMIGLAFVGRKIRK